MAHNINTYIGRQAAWHALGTVTGTYMTWAEILAHGGLDFTVIKNQLEFQGVQIDGPLFSEAAPPELVAPAVPKPDARETTVGA